MVDDVYDIVEVVVVEDSYSCGWIWCGYDDWVDVNFCIVRYCCCDGCFVIKIDVEVFLFVGVFEEIDFDFVECVVGCEGEFVGGGLKKYCIIC